MTLRLSVIENSETRSSSVEEMGMPTLGESSLTVLFCPASCSELSPWIEQRSRSTGIALKHELLLTFDVRRMARDRIKQDGSTRF